MEYETIRETVVRLPHSFQLVCKGSLNAQQAIAAIKESALEMKKKSENLASISQMILASTDEAFRVEIREIERCHVYGTEFERCCEIIVIQPGPSPHAQS